MNKEVKLLPPRWLTIIFLIFALIGFSDASYLTITHYQNIDAPCPVTQGCDRVLESQYATLTFNVPVALTGAIYYGILLALIMMYLHNRDTDTLLLAARGTIVGLLASLWFVYLQLFVIHAICIYCMLSAISSTILFGLGMRILVLQKRYGALQTEQNKK